MQKKKIIDKFQSLLLESPFLYLFQYPTNVNHCISHMHAHVPSVMTPISNSFPIFVPRRKHFIQNSINSLRPKPNNTCFVFWPCYLFVVPTRKQITDSRYSIFPPIQFERIAHNLSSIPHFSLSLSV